MKFVLGRKLQMTQLFDDNGIVHPVTAVMLEPLKITDLKTSTRDGYEAVQVGYGESKKSGKKLKEFRFSYGDKYSIGDEIKPSEVFDPGDVVKVSATSKGKGFQGVVKRHGFGGGPRSHGQKHDERGPGSIGSGLRTRVPKGTKLPGRMGGDRVTIKGTKVLSVDKDSGLMLLHGSIPGRRGTLVEIISI